MVYYNIVVFTQLGAHVYKPDKLVHTIDILIVAGGGGGGGVIGGGGGAGGLVFEENFKVTRSSYDLYVGNGGAGGTGWDTTNQNGTVGQNSSFGSLIAFGGGGGGSYCGGSNNDRSTRNGGSGAANSGIAVTGQGFNGGTNGDSNRGAGGGGAGEIGGNRGTNGGNGGNGLYFGNIFGDNFGQDGWFAGGGAGGTRTNNGVGGVGGVGGGGTGTSTSVKAGDGLTNTGGGGGGAGYNTPNSSVLGGNGGSGIVIIREHVFRGSFTGNLCFNDNNIFYSKKVDVADLTKVTESIFIYDKYSEELVNSLLIPNVSSVWANNTEMYFGTYDGVFLCDITNISGELTPLQFKQYPDITANEVLYLHGAGDYLCVATISGVDRYNLNTGERVYFSSGRVEKCFQMSDGGFYYYVNPELNTEVFMEEFDENIFTWEYARKIELDTPTVGDGEYRLIELPFDTPYNIYANVNVKEEQFCCLLNFTGASTSVITLNGFWGSAFSGRYDGDHFQGQCTLLAWVKPSLVDGTQRFVFVDTNDNEGILSFYSDRIRCNWGHADAILDYFTTVQVGKWYHVALWHRDEPENDLFRSRFFLDGHLMGENTRVLSTAENTYGPEGHLKIGQNFRGVISDVQIYDYAMTQEEIKRVASGLVMGNEDGLLAYLKLDEGIGNALYDTKRGITETIQTYTWEPVPCLVSDMLFLQDNGRIADYWIYRWDIGELPRPPVVRLKLDLGVSSVTMIYRNMESSFFSGCYPFTLADLGAEVDLESNCVFGPPGKIEDILKPCKLYAVYPNLEKFIYVAGRQSIINVYYINDIFVSEGTSSHSPGNVIFLATSWGAFVIEERRGDENNCRFKQFLLME